MDETIACADCGKSPAGPGWIRITRFENEGKSYEYASDELYYEYICPECQQKRRENLRDLME